MATTADIPADFFKIDEQKIRHVYRSGQQAQYYWLQTDAFLAESFIKYTNHLYDRFRVMMLYSEPGTAEILHSADNGWEIMQNVALSPFLAQFPSLNLSPPGGLMVFNTHVAGEALRIASSDLDDVDMMQLDDLSLEQVRTFWSTIRRLDPVLYVYQYQGTNLLIRGDDYIQKFMQTAEFTDVTIQRRAQEIARRKKHWKSLGAEIGPELCVQAGCRKLRIALAVRCIEHHIIYGTGAEQQLGPECGPETCIEPECERFRIKVALRCIRHQRLNEWF